MLEVLDFLCLEGDLVCEACKGCIQLCVHPREFVGQILQFIAGVDVERAMEFAASDRPGGLLQLPNRYDDPAGCDVAERHE